jgi:hypothetical protein
MEAVLETSVEVEDAESGSLVDRLFSKISEIRPDLPEPVYGECQAVIGNTFSKPEEILMCYRREEAILVRAALLSAIKWHLGEQKKDSEWSDAKYLWKQDGYGAQLEKRLHVYHVSLDRIRTRSLNSHKEHKHFRERYIEYLGWLKEKAGFYSDSPPPKEILEYIHASEIPELPETNAA